MFPVISDKDFESRPLDSTPFEFHFYIISLVFSGIPYSLPSQVLWEPKHRYDKHNKKQLPSSMPNIFLNFITAKIPILFAF
jgi:hypothetical protein